MINGRYYIKITFMLTIAALCLLKFVLSRQNDTFREFEAVFLLLQRLITVCLAVTGHFKTSQSGSNQNQPL
jgi:hypothetical protein